MGHDLSRTVIANVLETCGAYERRQIGEVELRDALRRNAATLRAIEPDAGRVLASFVGVVETIERTGAPELRHRDVCAVIGRIREFARFRDTRTPVPARS